MSDSTNLNNSLAIHVVCNYIKNKFESIIGSISATIELINEPIKEIIKELDVFEDYEIEDDVDFIELVKYLQSNIDKYIIGLGESASNSKTRFINDMKIILSENEYVFSDSKIADSLNLLTSTDIDKLVTFNKYFVSIMGKSLLSGSIMKLIEDYNNSEFVIGINLAIVEHNLKNSEIGELISELELARNFLLEKCEFCYEYIEDLIVDERRKLKENYITDVGRLNINLLLSDLTEERQNKIKKIKRIVDWIINYNLNEIKIKTDDDEIIINNLYSTSNNTIEDQTPEYIPNVTKDEDIAYLDIMFKVI